MVTLETLLSSTTSCLLKYTIMKIMLLSIFQVSDIFHFQYKYFEIKMRSLTEGHFSNLKLLQC